MTARASTSLLAYRSTQIIVSLYWSLVFVGHACAETAVGVPNDYSKCVLENAATFKGAITDNALDTLLLACIRLHEEAIGNSDISKVKIGSVYYGPMNSMSGLGLIIQIYNGSPYDITGLVIAITDKKTKEQRAYRYNQFIQYYRGPGIVTCLQGSRRQRCQGSRQAPGIRSAMPGRRQAAIRHGNGLVGRSIGPQPPGPGRLSLRTARLAGRPVPASARPRHYDPGWQGHVPDDGRIFRVRARDDSRTSPSWACAGQERGQAPRQANDTSGDGKGYPCGSGQAWTHRRRAQDSRAVWS